MKRCCGRPMLSSGYIDRVKENALFNIETLYQYTEQGYPIVGFEPSCVSMFTDEYGDLIDDPRVRAVADNIYTFEAFVQTFPNEAIFLCHLPILKKDILLHGHCHQKALWGMGPSEAALGLPEGFRVTPIQSVVAAWRVLLAMKLSTTTYRSKWANRGCFRWFATQTIQLKLPQQGCRAGSRLHTLQGALPVIPPRYWPTPWIRAMGNIKRIRVTISGRVQGVGFRYFTQREGERLGLVGWVKICPMAM